VGIAALAGDLGDAKARRAESTSEAPARIAADARNPRRVNFPPRSLSIM
jgi:hypothetical protein